eukprot:9466629-Pyramimonas_sp.AAC.1
MQSALGRRFYLYLCAHKQEKEAYDAKALDDKRKHRQEWLQKKFKDIEEPLGYIKWVDTCVRGGGTLWEHSGVNCTDFEHVYIYMCIYRYRGTGDRLDAGTYV